MWETKVEMGHYSIESLDHITAFEALWHRISTKGGALNYVVCKHIKYS